MYGQILPEKMTTSTKAVLWCAILLMAFFCLVNISGHSITNSVQHPTTLLHPTHRVITKG